MKNRTLIFLCALLAAVLTACGSGSSGKSSRYEEILKCGGHYVEKVEDSQDTYGADLSFYEKDGKVYANIEYSRYMGTIKDGLVEDSTNSDYKYEIHPKGELYSMEQDFTLLFDEEKLYITWADDCEGTLTRSDGSPEEEVDQRTPFDETEIYDTIVQQIDENYDSTEHKYVYDKDNKTFTIYFEAPENTRTALISYYDAISEEWENFVDKTTDMAAKIYDVTQVGDGYEDVRDFYIYWVDEIKDDNDYSDSEIDLIIKNGTVTYNLADENSQNSTSRNNSGSSSSLSAREKSSSSASSSSQSNSNSASAGERNALEKAKQYLKYTAFSYSGLIDQLEYEGYSTSEAQYAVDNCGADWYEQAVKKAQQYLKYSSFSRDGLQEQLEYEGFTSDQASYGVEQAYN